MTVNLYLLLAAIFAIAPSLGLLLTEIELQDVRLQIVQDLKTTLFKDEQDLPQLDLVMKRYKTAPRIDFQTYIKNIFRGGGHYREDLARRWSGALFYSLTNFMGFSILLVPLGWLIATAPRTLEITPSTFWGHSVSVSSPGSVFVAGAAFIGAWVFQMRFLIRATLNQELSALAFVRASLTTLIGIMVANIAYLAIVNGLSDVPFMRKDQGDGSELGFAMVMAFFIGFWPDLGIAKVARWLKVQVKSADLECLKNSKIIPLEVIDGIDTETSARLQESNLYDVQNLATINPIELYAETPYTLFQTFDWVIQAQLCTNVGCCAFQRLKSYKIRTIFDLERAVLANDVPHRYVASIGLVLFEGASADFLARTGLSRAPAREGRESAAQDAEIANIVRHAVAIICDDMHIHRLRRLWAAIMRSTGGSDGWLYYPGPLPGEGPANARQ